MTAPKHKLERKFGLFSVTSIVVANMIGAGIFTTSGLLMRDLNNPTIMLLLWVVGGGIALTGALCYGEIGAAIPKAGGEYIFLSELYHPMLGFLSGWISFIVGFSAPIAASSIGFSEYLYSAIPFIFKWGVLDLDFVKKIFAILIIIVFTAVHWRGVEFGAKVQNFLTILKVGLLVGLVIIGFSLGSGNMNHFKMASSFSFNFDGWKSVGLSLMWIMFAYSGWNASTYIGSEIKNPTKNLPWSLLIGTGIVLFLYICLNVLFVYASTPESMQGVISIGGLTMQNLFGTTVESIFSLLICIALFSSISAFIILGPRVYYAMAKDGYFFSFAAKLHAKYKVPTYSILFQAIISIIIILTSTLDQILTYMGFALSLFPILVVFGLFKLRRRGESVHRLPGYPATPILFILSGLIILTLGFLERPFESSMALATLMIGVPVYFFFKSYKTRESKRSKS